MLKHKKGQVGEIIATFPVMLLVIIIIGIFIALSFFVAKIKGPASVSGTSVSLPTNSLLLQNVDITINDKVENMLFFDAVVRVWREELATDLAEKLKPGPERFFLSLSPQLLQEENNCYWLNKFHYSGNDLRSKQYSPSGNQDYYFIFIDGKDTTGGSPEQSKEKTLGSWGELSFFLKDKEGKDLLQGMEYYYGGCKNE